MKHAEFPVHTAICDWLRMVLPHALVHHSAQGLDLGGPAAARAVAKARRMGMVKGYPDLTVHLPGGATVFFEVKAEGGRPDKDQKAVLGALTDLGFRAAVVRSVDDCRSCLAGWRIPTREVGGTGWRSIGEVVAEIVEGTAR